jgi:lysophospholipase L1-like esterase
MKRILRVAPLCLMLVPFMAKAQIDSSYQNTYYEQKVTQFRMIPKSHGKSVVFLGDSITDIGEWGEMLGSTSVKNRGVSGDITFGVLARLDEVTGRQPEAVYIMIGINDIANNVPDTMILRNYAQIISRIHAESPRTAVYVQSVLPTNNSFPEFERHQNKDGHIRAVNAALEKNAAAGRYTFVNLYPLFLDQSGRLDAKFTNDGLHLKGDGYRVWKDYLSSKGYLKL